MMQRHRTNLISRATVLLASLVALAAAPGEAAVILSGDIAEEAAVATIDPLDPRATYLRINSDAAALAVPIDLLFLGFTAGELVSIKPLGDFRSDGDTDRVWCR